MPPKALELTKAAKAAGNIMKMGSPSVLSPEPTDVSTTAANNLLTAGPESVGKSLDTNPTKQLRLSFDEVQQGLQPLYNWQYLDCDRGPLRDAFHRLAEDEQRVEAKLKAMEDVVRGYVFAKEELLGELERFRRSATDDQLKLYLDDPKQVDEVVGKMLKMLIEQSDDREAI